MYRVRNQHQGGYGTNMLPIFVPFKLLLKRRTICVLLDYERLRYICSSTRTSRRRIPLLDVTNCSLVPVRL